MGNNPHLHIIIPGNARERLPDNDVGTCNQMRSGDQFGERRNMKTTRRNFVLFRPAAGFPNRDNFSSENSRLTLSL